MVMARKFGKAAWLLGALALLLALAVAYTELVLHWSYSTGERAGFLQKLSYKGFVCKTWEGELQLVSMPGTTPEKFLFSVRDEALAKRLNAVMGHKVALSYEQHVGVPSKCFGESDYFVVDVKDVAG